MISAYFSNCLHKDFVEQKKRMLRGTCTWIRLHPVRRFFDCILPNCLNSVEHFCILCFYKKENVVLKTSPYDTLRNSCQATVVYSPTNPKL